MKKILIAVPEGYKYIELKVPDGLAAFIQTKAIKNISNGSTIEVMYLDEGLSEGDNLN